MKEPFVEVVKSGLGVEQKGSRKTKDIELLIKPKSPLAEFVVLTLADVKDWIYKDKILCFGVERKSKLRERIKELQNSIKVLKKNNLDLFKHSEELEAELKEPFVCIICNGLNSTKRFAKNGEVLMYRDYRKEAKYWQDLYKKKLPSKDKSELLLLSPIVCNHCKYIVDEQKIPRAFLTKGEAELIKSDQEEGLERIEGKPHHVSERELREELLKKLDLFKSKSGGHK